MRREMNDAHQPAPHWLFLLDAFARHAAAQGPTFVDLRASVKRNLDAYNCCDRVRQSVPTSEQLLGNTLP